MTIWNGTTMLNMHKPYISLESLPLTRVMNHEHMEQHSRISTTELTVMTRLYQKEDKKSISWMP